MNAFPIRFDILFNADEYFRSGHCPWTFFAYPTSLGDDRGLPPDDEACELLARLQQHGINVSIWSNGIAKNTTYFACRREDSHRLNEVVTELETRGIIERDFCSKRTERLFAQVAENSEPSDAPQSRCKFDRPG
ncbi:MAG: hypothetical protein MUC83_08120 [Pirellula sp.]|nr:hypothetical protein [Pirellula sp.]MCU0719656.1 hypothetical protein [Pirellula sp.]